MLTPAHHSAEHILTAVFGQLFNAKIIDSRFKGTKVRCDYEITSSEPPGQASGLAKQLMWLKDTPLEQIIAKAEKRANEIISENRKVIFEEVSREQAEQLCSLHRLPEGVQKIRLVRIGQGVVTPCNGEHVKNTSEIGTLKIRMFDWVKPGVIRLNFGVEK